MSDGRVVRQHFFRVFLDLLCFDCLHSSRWGSRSVSAVGGAGRVTSFAVGRAGAAPEKTRFL